MATEEPEPPEGFTQGPTAQQNDVPEADLSPGETLCGTIVDTHTDEGEYGPWVRLRINDDDRGPVDYFAEDEAKTMFFNDELTIGDDVWIAKSTETAEVNGNEYNLVKCRLSE